jgi:ABC-type bacteriocin/lantibiotic exporter with double-glycine peptidase domain
LSLVSDSGRRKLYSATMLQSLSSLLDLVGVLLVGLVSAVSISAITNSLPPSLVSGILDLFGLSNVEPLKLALVLAAIAGVALIFKSAISFAINRAVLKLLARQQTQISSKLITSVLRGPLLKSREMSSQQIAYAIGPGTNYATLYVLGQGIVAVSEISLLVVLAVGLFLLSPIVTIFTFLFFSAVGFLLHRILGKWAESLGQQSALSDIESTKAIQESIRGFKEIVVSRHETFYSERIADLRQAAAHSSASLQLVALTPKYVFESVLLVGGALLVASQLLTQDLATAVAVISVFLVAGSRIVPSILRLQSSVLMVRGAAQQAASTYELARLYAVSGTPGSFDARTIDHKVGTPDLGDYGQAVGIELSKVTFRYPEADADTVNEISLRIEPGSELAIVGVSGSGKSTLADLILGLLHPDTGTVRYFNGLEDSNLRRQSLTLAYVPQQVMITNGTIAQNVCLDDTNPRSDLIQAAIERVELAEFIATLPEGLNTQIGEDGFRLSGGQRQRLGLARALLLRPQLLVLDEATSALDASTEHAVSEMIRGMGTEVTRIVIAHRLATIRDCNQIVYISNGRVQAHGSFTEVRSQVREFDEQARRFGL